MLSRRVAGKFSRGMRRKEGIEKGWGGGVRGNGTNDNITYAGESSLLKFISRGIAARIDGRMGLVRKFLRGRDA